jgi:pilus assembly protein CpaE
MLMKTPPQPSSRLKVLALAADAEFEQSMRALAGGAGRIEIDIVSGWPARTADGIAFNIDVDVVSGWPARAPEGLAFDADVIVVDIDGEGPDSSATLQQLVVEVAGRLPIIAATRGFDADVGRRLMHLRIADFLLKPVTAADLMRACTRVLQIASAARKVEAEIFTFLPASGGVGVTTLAIQTALLLLGTQPKGALSTCLVDLDFQQGSCADYLDLEPRLDLDEIEPRPERLDAQLLEVMLSHHASGLAVVCAPNRPAEMRSFDPAVVTRLLDLVSVRFKYVVLDLPRTWFPWTDSVLVGSNRAYIVAEATVPGLRHANALISAIKQRLGEAAQPQVIVNRFEQRMLGPGLRRADIEQALGGARAATLPNDYRLVREAIDRGVPLGEIKPRNAIAAELRKLVLPRSASRQRSAPRSIKQSLGGLFQRAGSAAE